MIGWLSISAVIIAADQLSKQWIMGLLLEGESYLVTEFFNLVLAFNSGAAFSFLSQESGWQRPLFTVVALVASQVIVYLIYRHRQETLFCLSLSFILGGAVGNLWDRIVLGHVVDFLQFHYYNHFFPAFNVADSAISVGGTLLVWSVLLDMKKSKKAAL
jgi:signal peptidase II